jgi:membrane-bound lytic murein transglycosylase D
MSSKVEGVDRSGWRNRRLPAFSTRCALLGSASILLLAACSAPVVRPDESAPVAVALPLPVAVADLAVETPSSPVLLPEKPASPWPRLRARYAMHGCDYSPAVHQFAVRMTANPVYFSTALKQAMPFLLLVTEQIEEFDMPGEFAFLPWVESGYNVLPAHGKGVAGMWQLMPSTARGNGLRVDAEYDGRLDVVASSRVALALLKRYHESFGDWRLANMAFNAGENIVRAAIGKHRALTPEEISRLRLSRINYGHTTRLLAIACIVSAPERYRIELPEPDADDVLAQLELPAPLDLRLAAKLAGMDFAELRRLNPAYLKGRMPERGPFHLLVPAAQRAAIEKTLDMMPQYAWRNWREAPLQQPQSLDSLSMAYAVDAAALAQINRIDANTPLPAGTRLMLPERGSGASASTADNDNMCTEQGRGTRAEGRGEDQELPRCNVLLNPQPATSSPALSH